MKLNSIGLLPNFRKKEFNTAGKLIFQLSSPSEQPASFRQKLIKFLNLNNESKIFLFDSARSSFSVLLEALNLEEDSEIIMPSFTCVVIANPVIWHKLRPVFVDITLENFNPDIQTYIDAITEKTKMIVVQHTFGLQVNIDQLKSELKKINREDILIVEDLAHSFGQDYENNVEKLGTKADFSIITTGLEKVISSLRGGVLICNNSLNSNYDFEKITNRLIEIEEKLPNFPKILTFRLLLNTQLWRLAIPYYYFGISKLTIGRILAFIGRIFGLIGLAIEKGEYKAEKPKYLPAKFSPKLARLGELQLSQYDELSEHRTTLTKIYNQELQNTKFDQNLEQKYIFEIIKNQRQFPLLRYPLVLDSVSEKNRLLKKLSSNGFILGDWYDKILYTSEDNLNLYGYKTGQNSNTENIMKKIINLPTSIITNEADAKFIVKLISEE